ncbi:unnamed protein product, partial [Candidula unifasciata]
KLATLVLIFVMAAAFADGQPKASKCRVGWTYFGGSCYAFGDIPKTYDDAAAFCVTHGGYLAEVESVQENNWLINKLTASNFGSVWIGGSETLHRGTFLWVNSGNPLIFADWSFMQPIDPPGVYEDCLEMREQFSYKWNDFECNQLNRFVCEIRSQPLED